ncbi:MAG: DUF3667 domain-containing protein [Saonia sp.]
MNNKPTIRPKGRYRLKYRGTQCLNCEHPLDMSDKYCPNCSQANSTKKLSLKDFFDEFFSSIISYDSKLLKTLSALLLRPGRITKDYVSGKRVSYTNPFRFLLSLAIVYFLMLSFSGDFSQLDRYGEEGTDSLLSPEGTSLTFTSNDIELNEDEKKEALKQLDSLGIPKMMEKATIDSDSIIMSDPKGHFKKLTDNDLFKRLLLKQKFFQTVIQKKNIYTFQEASATFDVAETYENRAMFNTARSFLRALRQPGTFINDLMAKLPFLVFFFLPVFALFIWLIYIRKKYNYTDHLIFSFHNQSLLFILLIISFLADSIFKINSSGIFVLVFSFYLYRSMRKFYGQGRFKTIVKFMFLNTIFFILATISTVIILTGSVFTY